MAERLRFGAEGPRGAPLLPGTTRLVAALLGLAALAAVGRLALRPSLPDGVMVEVRGEVPRPGLHLVREPTVHRAIEAAGGAPVGSDRPLAPGDRVEVGPDGARVLPPSDPLLVGLPIDPNTADAAALAAIPGVGQATAEAIVADREARGPFRSLDDLRRVEALPPDGVAVLAPFVTLRPAGPPDLNRASAAELERLDGIGPVLAARIVVERAERGPFGSVDELARVDGISPALIERLRGQVVVAP